MFDFAAVGGVARSLTGAAVDSRGAVDIWNFGSQLSLTCPFPTFESAGQEFHGAWDGRTAISHWEVTKRVLHYGGAGEYLPAQHQKIGSCVGAGCSGALNVLQCLRIAAGDPEVSEFKPVSRAWCYAGARTRSGILGQGDGAVGHDALEWTTEKGIIHQGECPDNDYAKDEVAKQWGARGIPQQYMDLARDNPSVRMFLVKSVEELRDGIAAGGVFTVASDQGFDMQRNRFGICEGKGTWMHQMYGAAVMELDGGIVYGIGQSWGPNVPGGDLLPGCPNYVFGVRESVMKRMVAQNNTVLVFGLKGWRNVIDLWSF